MTDQSNTVPLITEQLLEDYADGRLDAQTERRVEGLISQDHAQREKVFRMIALREAIRADVSARAGTPKQEETYRLMDEIAHRERAVARPPLRKATMALAASVLVVGFTGLAWTQLSGGPGSGQDAAINRLLAGTNQQEALVPANGGGGEAIPAKIETAADATAKQPVPEVVPDFASAGFNLVETRILADQPKQAVHLLYETEDGRRVSLYYSQAENGRNQEVRVRQEGPLSILFWHAEGRSFSMIGEVGRSELVELARKVTTGLSLENEAKGSGQGTGSQQQPKAAPQNESESQPEAKPEKEQQEQADAV